MVDFEWDWHDKTEIVHLAGISTRKGFERYLESRRDEFPELEYYLENGTWRNTDPLTDEEEEKVDLSAHNQLPRQCYYNAQTGMMPDLRYVEGYTVGQLSTVPHAWLEINGKVAEITPTIKRDSQQYYGVEFDHDIVAEAMLTRETAEPMVEWVVE